MWSPSKGASSRPAWLAGEGGASLPVVLWPLAIVGLLTLVGLAMLFVRECGKREVVVPSADLPVAHLISVGDLETKKVSNGDVNDSYLSEEKDLLGRVATTTLAAGEPVAEVGLTAVRPTGFDGLVPAAFHADSATAGAVKSGQWVRLGFAPTADSSSVGALSVDAVLLSADEGESGETDYVVAVCKADREAMLEVLARARLMVTSMP